jgi:two-component system, sensor histidine kinase and response regulator
MKNKVLIVDDDTDSTIIQQSIAQKLGYYTQIAINGLDAIKFIKHDPPDLILLDIFMPQMDGFETISLINKKYKIPTIVVTAGGNEAIKRIKEMGVLFYVQKPIVPTKLQKEINKCVKYYEENQ